MNITTSPGDRTIRLTDGRFLGYREFGDPAGSPVFFFHGIPGSRCGGELVANLAAEHQLRVIGIDRPGIGLSTFQPDRTFLDWPHDVEALADTLGLAHFAVVGNSGGAAYVAVCAARLPERLTFAGIISGMGPLSTPDGLRTLPLSRTDRLLAHIAQRSPRLACLAAAPIVAHRIDPDRPATLQRMKHERALADLILLDEPHVATTLSRDAGEALRQGRRGVTWDLILYTRPWGFRLDQITAPVYLWHGEADITVPPQFGRVIAAAIPGCQATYWPDEGHLMMISRADQIIGTIAANVAA
jgi:pimeloyl-ACP methyl ester carboxylesterase